jgi:hypothetical protein
MTLFAQPSLASSIANNYNFFLLLLILHMLVPFLPSSYFCLSVMSRSIQAGQTDHVRVTRTVEKSCRE